MKPEIVFFVVLALCSNIGQLRAQSPKVCLDGTSCVLGKFMPGYEKSPFEAFLGIPFAKPPIGPLRFSDPVEADSWEGTRSAENARTDCIQKNFAVPSAPVSGVEDCLYLNVYRPQNRSSENLPVLFYIHGGGFFAGSPSPLVNGPEYFMDTNEVILVVPAYRLGLFGFLSTNDVEMTGNFGLKDQNLALKWVNKHISAFGGDPARVTISGHSSGGASVELHMLSPASKGLFQNAILMSGVGNVIFAKPVADPKAQVIQLAKSADIDNAKNLSTAALVAALREINEFDLLSAADAVRTPYRVVTFRPNIEQPDWPNAFATNDVFQFLDGILEGTSTRITVPWITGNVPSKGEGFVIASLLAIDPALRDKFNQNFNDSMIAILEMVNTEESYDSLGRLVPKYMGGEYQLHDNTWDGFLQLLGDAHFMYPTFKAIETALSSTSDPSNNLAGIINFDYRGPNSFSSFYTASLTNYSTVHWDDILYLFTAEQVFPGTYPISSPEAALVKRYVQLYVNFVKTGKVPEFEKMEPCTKPSLLAGTCQYLSIVKSAAQFQVDNKWDIENMELMTDVYNNNNNKKIIRPTHSLLGYVVATVANLKSGLLNIVKRIF